MVIITGIVATATAVYARGELSEHANIYGFYPLFHVLVGGISGAFLTGDLFNLYVCFEVMLMASFGLLIWGQTPAQLDAAVKYVVINLLATLLLLMGLALLYGLTGTLNIAHIHQKLLNHEAANLLTAVAFILMTAFGIKAGLFPLFFWLPAAYHTPLIAVSALFAGMLTKVGVYALIRIFSLVFFHDISVTLGLLLIMAALTMVTGVLGAAAQNEFRRILSFHIISQVGYMILGIALWTPLAIAGAIFYLVHHMIVKANLFLISGLSRDVLGTLSLDKTGGLYRSKPFIALLFFIPAFSLAGFPPLSGFWAKLLIIQSSLQVRQYLLAAVAVLVGLMTIYSMVKIWLNAFWKPLPSGVPLNPAPGLSLWKVAPVCALTLLTLCIGFAAEPIYLLAAEAAREILNPELYVQAVLKGGLP
ncbi:MAG: Na+/H+ antiporter subunit D [Deltaproteobacteria bacterium]|jgi:multicomponent Na+:H+ antiporter subunit D|nr:Na+/H+ antiporter subunit D [Deltaproteobacteria bacterium]